MPSLSDKYAKPKPGESASDKTARQKKYYSSQRESAQERGDQGTVDKIYGKLGKKAPNVDSDRGNKALLAGIPAAATGGLGLARMLGTGAAKAAGSALVAGGSKLASKAGSVAAKDVKQGASGASRALGGAKKAISGEAKKAITGVKQKMLPAPKDSTMKSGLKSISKSQSGKAKFSESKSSGRREDGGVRSKAGPSNREAAGKTKKKG
jgi:hypothetical protein